MPQPDSVAARPANGSDTAPIPNTLLVEDRPDASPGNADGDPSRGPAPAAPRTRRQARLAREAEQRARRDTPADADLFSRPTHYGQPDARALRDEHAAGPDSGRPVSRHAVEPSDAAPPAEALRGEPADGWPAGSDVASPFAPPRPEPSSTPVGEDTADTGVLAPVVGPGPLGRSTDPGPSPADDLTGGIWDYATRDQGAQDYAARDYAPPGRVAQDPDGGQLDDPPDGRAGGASAWAEPPRRGGWRAALGALPGRARPVLLGSSRRGAAVRAGAAVALVAALVAGLTTWSVFDRTVLVDVDGEIREVSFLGSEVTDALAAADVTVGEDDLVQPAVGSTVAEGDTVTVRYGRPFTVRIDGEESTYITHGLTVEEAIATLGLRLEDAVLSASRSTPIGREGLDIDVITPKEATVVLSGAEQSTTTTARTVRDLLVELGVEPDDDDRVDPALDTVVTAGMRVTYSRVDVTEVTEEVPIPAPSRTVEDDDLAVGETEVVEEGVDGVETVYFRVVTVDGLEELREEVRREVTTEAVEEVVAEGTQQGPAPSGGPVPAPGGDVASLNWGALAECESGGNPTIVSPNGLYHGLYQFDAGTWQSVGGSGVASQAPASEQTARAQVLYEQRGSSPWPHCGSRLYS